MKDFSFKTIGEVQNEIELLEDSIENLEEVVGESCTSENEEYWDETFSPYYEQLEVARGELRGLKALHQQFQRESKPQVDFDLLINMLRKGGVGSVLENTYCNPTQDELRNLALFFKAMKNPKFATKASHILNQK